MTDELAATPAPIADVEATAPGHFEVTAPDHVEATAPAAGGALHDELVVLDGLEADLAAVQAAIETIDRIAADDASTGERAASEISAAVSPERFGTGLG